MGASEVVLSEQPQLVPLLEKNVARNFGPAPNEGADRAAVVGPRPQPTALSWGTAEAEAFLAARGGRRPDVVLVCDCVFEPLYDESWRLLCDTLAVRATRFLPVDMHVGARAKEGW